MLYGQLGSRLLTAAEKFKKIEGKSELTLYHLIRLVTQEIIKLADPRSIDAIFDWQGKLIKDAFGTVKDEGK